MISICIPVYNFYIKTLLNELEKQMLNVTFACELILIDDCSGIEYKAENKKSVGNHTYIELSENIGRSRIRNLFLQYAQFPNLIFIDCDSYIHSSSFLLNYYQTLTKHHAAVICGGRVYPQHKPKRANMLRYSFGIYRESKPAIIRKENPYKSFMTNNFLIPKTILQTIKFNESLVNYGHEDTLFGYELKRRNIPIIHIENSVLNGDIETNNVYLQKTEQGIANLARMVKEFHLEKPFVEDVRVLKIYFYFKKIKLLGFIRFVFLTGKPILKSLLTLGYSTMFIFDFFKLGLLIGEMRK